jgi:hypothetical protein
MMLLSLQVKAAEPLKGASNTEFGAYTLIPSEVKIMKEGLALETYDLLYENVTTPVKVAVERERNCRNFIVRYPSFEIQYVCNKWGFGVKRMYPGTETVHPVIVNSLLDETQFAYQEMILNKPESDEEVLQLIACYFPKLIKKEIRSLVNS